MSQRLIAACVAVPAILGLLVFAWVARLPYATYSPGGTLDVLGSDADQAEIIQVDGAEVYRDAGALRMTTVRVSSAQPPEERGLNLIDLVTTWFDGDNAVYPYDAVHQDDATVTGDREAGALQMATSQDAAIDVALTEMDIEVPQVLQVVELEAGMPAAEVLQIGDVLRSVDGADVDNAEDLVSLIGAGVPGEPLSIGITRDGARETVRIVPVERDGRTLIGVTPAVSDYEFPFEVRINVPPEIGGPSAGLIFSLAVYDTLTEGSLTGDHEVAGTGEINPDGTVGPIGGIQQKVAGARDDGVELFLVPVENCADALQADNGDMRLMMAETMHDVRLGLEAYAADVDVDLPSCEDADEVLAGAAP